MTREHDPGKAAEIEAWIDRLAGSWNILPVDGATFRTWARLMHSVVPITSWPTRSSRQRRTSTASSS